MTTNTTTSTSTGTASASTPTAPAAVPRPGPAGPPVRGAGWTALVQGLLIFAPVVVLGRAIGWPASLGDPASSVLPRLAAHEDAVRIGYLTYLAHSVLFGVTVVLLLRLVEDALPRGARRLAVGFAVASVVARCIGIVRWLGPAPVLAHAYGAAADDTQRYAVTQVYDAVDSYGGIIGEALGVGLFAAASIGILSAGLLATRAVPRWLAVGAVVAAVAVLVDAVELTGADLGPVLVVSVTVVQLWFLATGAWLLVRARRAAGWAQQPGTPR